MADRKKGLLREVKDRIQNSKSKYLKGWRLMVVSAALLLLVFYMGIWSAIVVFTGLAGLISIFVISKTNSKWISEFEKEKNNKRRRK